ncbi:uncharacterized protein LOC131071776 isoform X4 [Cryptomeria japonica]|uniref:uncharacterized protein LOC131071776 isoform X4 n=1 Tax=Cryptomeria japonica TaxID=3369 RepID=UPI0027DA395E|nr:uncharacterized protein LOC131071776 isoform X4 [Cryptomeria japonica]
MGSGNALEECLKLLRGERDEQRLAGLLLATKFCQGDDKGSVVKVFNAVGMLFLDRLLKTGIGQSTGNIPNKDQQEAYLQLALTILAAFCRVPELASLDDIISKVPVILGILSNKPEQSVSTECCECLLEIATASEKGFLALYEARALATLANHVSHSSADSPSLQMAMVLMKFLLDKMPVKTEISEYSGQLATVAVAIARQFAIQQTLLKFDALLLMLTLTTSEHLAPIRMSLKLDSRDAAWPTYVRSGIGTILQNRVDNYISESTMVKATVALNETVGVIIDFLWDAKVHDMTKGDDLLASVRVVCRYLAETPLAYKVQFQQLLSHIMSITGQDEERPFLSIQFSLPTLCQTTMDPEGCIALVSCEGHKQVLEFLLRLLQDISKETIGTVLLACDIIMNVLLKRDDIQAQLRVDDFVSVLPALAAWTAKHNDSMVIAMAACTCTLVLDLSSENSLAKIPEFDIQNLYTLSELITRSLELFLQDEKSAIPADNQDLYDITVSGCARLVANYPSIRQAIRTSNWFQNILQNQSKMNNIMDVTENPSMQDFLASIIS